MLVVKGVCGDEVRRIPILNKELTYDELCFMMHRLFRDRLSSNVNNLVLKYTDAEGDLVTMTDSVDVTHALEHSNILRVTVFDKELLPVPRSDYGGLAPDLKRTQLGPDKTVALRRALEDLQRRIDLILKTVCADSAAPPAPGSPDDAAAAAGAAAGKGKPPADAPKTATTPKLSTSDMAELLGSNTKPLPSPHPPGPSTSDILAAQASPSRSGGPQQPPPQPQQTSPYGAGYAVAPYPQQQQPPQQQAPPQQLPPQQQMPPYAMPPPQHPQHPQHAQHAQHPPPQQPPAPGYAQPYAQPPPPQQQQQQPSYRPGPPPPGYGYQQGY